LLSKAETTAQIELRHNASPLFWHDVTRHPVGIVCIENPLESVIASAISNS